MLASGVFSEIDSRIMEEASVSTLCSLLLKVEEADGEKDMVR